MKYLKQIAYVLLIIGGINWGVYGVSGYDIVNIIFGSIPVIANIIYVLVGLSAVYILLNRYVLCDCKKSSCSDSCCKDAVCEVKPEEVK
jgi:uncharacterized membrane protein YuzA (DUF378 family)